MAASGGMADIQRRAAEDPVAGYRAFDSYPWQKDWGFMTQLATALENITPNGSNLSDVALEVRIFWFEQKTKITIDGEQYKQWLGQNSQQPLNIVAEQAIVAEAMAVPPADRKLAHLLVELGNPLGQLALQQNIPNTAASPPSTSPPDPSVPSWQSAAPKSDLYVQKDSTNPSDPGKEPYPKKFEEIIEFLQTGKEIPGIRKIPDTVVEDPSISTQGRLAAPLKPWERRARMGMGMGGGSSVLTAESGSGNA
ncbi:Uu.00g068020.m01.CDS01 [Anthostomella pinea]|uniref:Uu.00g068020.m01.CDS01 n=1 Tax=Anthostomella pinea TaxID=933095 RepID=A0AAI8YL11_9PEZI|nr:Uu.00g068020.m01.CDS01 [Anthostomella pinea]